MERKITTITINPKILQFLKDKAENENRSISNLIETTIVKSYKWELRKYDIKN